jgi:hypothetical protein
MGILWLFYDPFQKCDRKHKERKFLRKLKNMEDKWTGHMLCTNCFLTLVVEVSLERKIEGKRRWGRRCKQLLDYFKERILDI